MRKCFPQLLNTAEGSRRMSELIPTWNLDARKPEMAERFLEIRQQVDQTLQLG